MALIASIRLHVVNACLLFCVVQIRLQICANTIASVQAQREVVVNLPDSVHGQHVRASVNHYKVQQRELCGGVKGCLCPPWSLPGPLRAHVRPLVASGGTVSPDLG